MKKIKFIHLCLFFGLFFVLLSYIFYQKTQETALDNAYNKIDELLLSYKAVRSNVSNFQKQEVYNLQNKDKMGDGYFSPVLLSSTFNAKIVSEYYNLLKKEQGKKPIELRFASDNPRNPSNKATKKESEILKRFNNNEIKEYTEIIKKDDGTSLYYVLPTKRTTAKCMKCHSDPSIAPKGLVEIYGDKNGFFEKEGNIRAILSTTYPLDDDLAVANQTFVVLTLITFLIFSILLLVIYIFMRKIEDANKTLDDKVNLRTQQLNSERKYLKTIIDNNPSIIIVTNKSTITTVNKQFLKFFKVKDLEEFLTKTSCICDYFIDFDSKKFDHESNMVEDQLWCDYLHNTHQTVHHISLRFEEKLYFFIINAVNLNENGDVLVTLQNITEQKEQEKLLIEKERLASMGEMIGNIAHQWRQPLSVISTGATGMILKKEFGTLTDDEFFKTCNMLEENAQYLSQTIDDFRDFIKGERKKVIFNVKENIESFLHLVEGSIKSNNINIISDIQSDIVIENYPNELIQCYINIFNNSKDVFKEKNIQDKLFFITAFLDNDKVVIILKDNAGGIPQDIITRIFDPYFTTKHQSQGTGLGLHMTYNIINNGSKGKIFVENSNFTKDEVQYSGAQFVIELPK